MDTLLELSIAGGFRAASAARLSLEPLRNALDDDLVDDIRFLVNELVTNSIRHGRVGARQHIGLKVLASDDTVRVEVRDPGPGFTPKPRPHDDDSMGWGLHLVQHLSDRWGVTRDGEMCVWFEMARTRARAQKA
ncbi:MAG: ATP-binding protein [Actinomycetota bacterium]